jgi:hypothetical protein
MSASAAIHSYGTTIAYSTTSGGSYTTIGEVHDLDEDQNVPEFKVTNFGSPSATHEFRPKMIDPGEASGKGNYVNSIYSTLFGYQQTRTILWFKITTPDNSVANGQAWVSKLKKTEPDDDGVKQEFTVRKTGPWTFTP